MIMLSAIKIMKQGIERMRMRAVLDEVVRETY